MQATIRAGVATSTSGTLDKAIFRAAVDMVVANCTTRSVPPNTLLMKPPHHTPTSKACNTNFFDLGLLVKIQCE
jgi:hypothetical protein